MTAFATEETRMRAAVMIADLSGFTAMTEVHGDQMAAELGAELLDLAGTDSGDARLLTKGLGDGVLVVDKDPAAVARRAFDMLHHVGTAPRHLRLRVAIHHGPVVSRGGDVYGQSINVAARLVEAMPTDSVRVTGAFLGVAGDLPAVTATPRGRVALRDIRDPVEVHELMRCRDGHLEVVDPTCRMTLDPRDPTLVWRRSPGGDVAYCSLACARGMTEGNAANTGPTGQ